LRLFVRRGLLPADDARAMAQWQHGGGFSVDASVRIEAADRAGRERLLRNSRPATVRPGTATPTRWRAAQLRPPEIGPRGSRPQMRILDRELSGYAD